MTKFLHDQPPTHVLIRMTAECRKICNKDTLCMSTARHGVSAGTYGVMTLFGLLPAGMAWLQRYGGESGTGSSAGMKIELVPGGKLMLGGVGGFAVAVIVYELAHKLHLL